MKKRISIFFYFLPLICFGQAFEQTGNPFELEWRMLKSDSSGTSDFSGNPFEVVPHEVPQTSYSGLSKSTPASKIGFWDWKRFGREPKSFLFWLVFFNLALLSFVVAFSRGAISKAWNAFLNQNQFVLLLREWSNGQLALPYVLLYVNYVVNLGFFVYLSLKMLRNQEVGGMKLFLFCLAITLTLLLIKHFVLWVMGSIFPVGETTEKYSFLIASANITAGLFLIPFNLLIAFVQNIQGFLVFWVLTLVGIFYTFRAFRALGFGSKIIASNKFHFLLYLCAFEIMPILLLSKVIWTKII